MSYEISCDYSQEKLINLPLNSYITGDHILYLIIMIFKMFDLEKLGFPKREIKRGQKPYSPDLMLKLVVYSYTIGKTSTRDIEKVARYDLPAKILISEYIPDHSTICRFIKSNKNGINRVFSELVKIAIDEGIIDNRLVAIDGTKVKSKTSYNNKLNISVINKELDKVHTLMINLLNSDEAKDIIENSNINHDKLYSILDNCLKKENDISLIKVERINRLSKEKDKLIKKKEVLKEKGLKQFSLTDNESKLMKFKNGISEFGYNGQIAVESKSHFIIASDVVTDQSDNFQMNNMIDKAMSNTDKAAETYIFDAGYQSSDQLVQAFSKGHNVILPINDRNEIGRNYNEKYLKENFKYDEEKKVYICPENKELYYKGIHKDKKRNITIKTYFCKYCKDCNFREDCTTSEKGRIITIPSSSDEYKMLKERLQIKENQEKLKKRQGIVEHVFYILKHVIGINEWKVKGIENAKIQWTLACIAYNIKILEKQCRLNKISFKHI